MSQCLHFLHRQKKANPPPIFNTFYRDTLESMLTQTLWPKTLQQSVRTAEKSSVTIVYQSLVVLHHPRERKKENFVSLYASNMK